MKINLLYMSRATYGGWATFTVHLYKSLQAMGIEVSLHKVRNNTERTQRPFGYDIFYQNLKAEDALRLPNVIVTAYDKYGRDMALELYRLGAHVVIHDPNEIKNAATSEFLDRIIVIRKSMLEYLKSATFIPHPYIRFFDTHFKTEEYNAVTVGRLDFDKKSDIIFTANQFLPEDKQVHIRGCENRAFTRLKLKEQFGYLQDSEKPLDERLRFPKEWGWAANLCRQGRFMVDLSVIKGDGGGSQYSFMEAMDGGAICIIHNAWIRDNDEMIRDVNCLTVSTAEELTSVLKQNHNVKDLYEMRQQGYKLLENHTPERVIPNYLELFI